MQDYWARIMATLKRHWQPGDQLVLASYFREPDRVCELCGHRPITHNFVLQNQRTGTKLNVGRKCVRQYKEGVRRLEGVVTITFPRQYSQLAAHINAMFPDTVVVDDIYVEDSIDPLSEDELRLLSEELDEYNEDWARAGEEGWFYSDEDDETGPSDDENHE